MADNGSIFSKKDAAQLFASLRMRHFDFLDVREAFFLYSAPKKTQDTVLSILIFKIETFIGYYSYLESV